MPQVILSPNCPAPVSTYSQAVVSGNQVITSGYIGLDMDAKMVEGGAEPEARQTFENLKAIIETAGSDMSKVLKVNIYVTDLADMPAVVGVYNEFFKDPYPCRSGMAVAGLPLGAKVMIDMVAEL